MSTTAAAAAALPGVGGEPARLLGTSSGPLVFTGVAIAPGSVASLHQLARARGRVLERDGLCVLALGSAARIELPFGIGAPGAARAAEQLLASIPPAAGLPRGPASARALALGVLPFSPREPAGLELPALAVVARGGAEAVAVALGDEARVSELVADFPFDASRPPPPAPPLERAPDRFELVSRHGHEHFERLVSLALGEIERGDLDKVVCAREVTVTANRPFEQGHLVERLRALYPSCLVAGIDGFVAASPELLVRRSGRTVSSQPLAGTIARSGDPDKDARLAAGLLASPKERREHAIVVEAIAAGLRALCTSVSVPDEPHLLELRNVSHLATTISADLGPGPSSRDTRDTPEELPGTLALLAAIHPTPAVAGVPAQRALDFIATHEGVERGRYAGAFGYLDAAGDGEMWLGIRSAMIEGGRARLLAGVGIVAGSIPHEELVETQLKLQALLAAAVRP